LGGTSLATLSNLWRAMLSRWAVRHGLRRIPACVICSPGGVAATALIDYVSKNIRVNSSQDSDGLKHLPTPRMLGSSKVLFISGNPDKVVKSLARRRYLAAQAVKLGGLRVFLLAPRGEELRNLVLELIERQEQHFLGRGKNVLIVRGEELYSSGKEIAEFFDIRDERFVTGYPIRKLAS
jgi:hypothetical protein